MSINEYRCTRNQPYQNPGCPGHTNLELRCGYYIQAETPELAIAQMEEICPDDELGFTVEVWTLDPENDSYLVEAESPRL